MLMWCSARTSRRYQNRKFTVMVRTSAKASPFSLVTTFKALFQGFQLLFGSYDPDRIRIKVKGRIRTRIKWTSRIRIRIKVMRIRNIANTVN
jgi:hypothetical protein